MRNVVMSDTGGWLPQLLNSFDLLGIDAEAGTMPEGLRVVHCGDLIHKGPYSDLLVAIVTQLMVNNPGQWVQLLGNHEAQHLPGAPHFWSCSCLPQTVGALNALYEERLLLPTFGLEDGQGFSLPEALPGVELPTAMVFSHGGLTAGFWQAHAGTEASAVEASRLLNELPLEEVAAPGQLLGYGVEPARVGPVWAIGNTEVFDSWRELEGQPMPFTQFHGHTTSFNFDRRYWWGGLERFRKTAVLLPKQRAVATELNNNLMVGVDPGFSEGEPAISHQPWFEFTTAA